MSQPKNQPQTLEDRVLARMLEKPHQPHVQPKPPPKRKKPKK